MIQLINADCRDALKALPDASVDSVVTDPPYELGFMGKGWDASGIAYDVSMWREVLRVLKPGGHVLAFGGTRTYHRMAVAIEDAGFEIRDSLHWIYGSGFPKSHNLSDKWQGWGTALKPAHEPVVVARKPLVGTVAASVQAHGTGALNIDGCRVQYANDADMGAARVPQPAFNSPTGAVYGFKAGEGRNGDVFDPSKGRWPPNILLSHAPGCGETCAEGCPVAEMDRQSGVKTGKGAATVGGPPRSKSAHIQQMSEQPRTHAIMDYGDSGGASRFFPVFRYQAKASRSERNAGLEAFPESLPKAPNGSPNAVGATRGSLSKPRANIHPTVKPVDLMRWLVRLVTPPGGVVLEPFMGSGTTGVACVQEGFAFIGVEREPQYFEICRARIEAAQADKPTQPELFE